MFLVVFISPIIYSYIGFGSINALCHKNGKVVNLMWINLLAAGEGYHKNHHEDPRSWKLGAYDPSAWFIKYIKK
jgi:fatty-acid desaturase